MLTLSNTQSIRDVRAAQRNNARSYEDLRVEAENAAYDAYKVVDNAVLALQYGEMTELEAGITLAEAKALRAARKKEWRDLVHSH